jgi:hypothetical protein
VTGIPGATSDVPDSLEGPAVSDQTFYMCHTLYLYHTFYMYQDGEFSNYMLASFDARKMVARHIAAQWFLYFTP